MKTNSFLYQGRRILATSFLVLSLFFVSCGSCDEESGDNCSTYNLQIPGVDGPNVNLLQDIVLITFVFENIQIDGGLRYAIPKYPNSYIEISPDLQSMGTLMAVSISLQDIFNGGLNQLPPLMLPGGRPLPGVASGTLPAIAFSIEKFNNMTFYLGPDVFGIFVPIKGLNMQGASVTARFYSDGIRTGNISLIGEDLNSENGGILLMLDMSKTTTRRLETIAEKYD